MFLVSTQAELVELYQSSKANNSEHIKHIFSCGSIVVAFGAAIIVYCGHFCDKMVYIKYKRNREDRNVRGFVRSMGLRCWRFHKC